MKKKVFKWFKHVVRMSEECSSKRKYGFEMEGKRDRGRPCTRWLHGVKKACKARGCIQCLIMLN